MTKDNFFEKLVPQSTYRKTDKEQESTAQNYLNLALPKLKNINNKQKEALKNLITEKREEIILALLPEKLIEPAKNDGYLEKLFSELGIK
jgi:predicted ArsR family transcriptional regulator